MAPSNPDTATIDLQSLQGKGPMSFHDWGGGHQPNFPGRPGFGDFGSFLQEALHPPLPCNAAQQIADLSSQAHSMAVSVYAAIEQLAPAYGACPVPS